MSRRSGEGFPGAVKGFRARGAPVELTPVGYAALIERYQLRVPLPARLAGIQTRHLVEERDGWLLLTPRHAPSATFAGHLEFALKWEGVDLSVLKALFEEVGPAEVMALVRASPTGRYARRAWFLYEWLTGKALRLRDAPKVVAAPALDPEQQLTLAEGELSRRHRVVDNLPGTPAFCPLVRRTAAVLKFGAKGLPAQAARALGRTHPDVLARASAFLLLSDSRASFEIEGEKPGPDRARRWGQAIGDAGKRALDVGEFERLQRVVLGDARLVTLGLRKEGGFIGLHDRRTGEPFPDHISAKPEDLRPLLQGVAAYEERALRGGMDPVATAAAVAFGFVYVHPFADGNGRLHRWLVHHVLNRAQFHPDGLVFPVSAAIQRDLAGYRAVLESYSKPLLPLIEWEPTTDGNVQVTNQTADYYRYFDATAHTEFLYRAVEETIHRDLPDEVRFLEGHDRFVASVAEAVDLPRRQVELLHRFLTEGNGKLSKRGREREFKGLRPAEVARVEKLFAAAVKG